MHVGVVISPVPVDTYRPVCRLGDVDWETTYTVRYCLDTVKHSTLDSLHLLPNPGLNRIIYHRGQLGNSKTESQGGGGIQPRAQLGVDPKGLDHPQ